MRGAWQAEYEYIFELHTEQEVLSRLLTDSRTRYSARVLPILYGVLEEVDNVNCL